MFRLVVITASCVKVHLYFDKEGCWWASQGRDQGESRLQRVGEGGGCSEAGVGDRSLHNINMQHCCSGKKFNFISWVNKKAFYYATCSLLLNF